MFLVNILLTALCYMAFPLLRLLINKGKFEEKKAKRIALWNSIVVGFIFCVATVEISGDTSAWNAAPAVLYYFINRAILIDKKKDKGSTTARPTAESAAASKENSTRFEVCLSSNTDKINPAPIGGFDFYGKDFRKKSLQEPAAETEDVIDPKTDEV